MCLLNYDNCEDACYLGSAIVVTSVVLGEHTSVEELYPRTTLKLCNRMVVISN
jgi:hypothetical protein